MLPCVRRLRVSRYTQYSPLLRTTRKIIMQQQPLSQQQLPIFSDRIKDTNSPTVVRTKQIMSGRKDTLSLAQGIVHWKPPQAAFDAASKALKEDPLVSCYGPDEGMPELRAQLRKKIAQVNGLDGYNVLVTAGANQAFVNCLLTFCGNQSGVVLFKPYYFNHLMAIQMTGSSLHFIAGKCHPDSLQPDLDWLEQRFNEPNPPSMVVMVNPCNPTGVLMDREALEKAAEICGRYRAWLIMDDTYENFVFDDRQHYCVNAPHAYGMMGWRIGYIAYPDYSNDDAVGFQIVKTQDTIVVCASQIGQHVALGALSVGQDWIKHAVKQLDPNRRVIRDALSPLEPHVYGGEGALYFWAKLPDATLDDDAVVEWLVKEYGVCLIPGSSCGCPGHIRIAFGNLPYQSCKEASRRLKQGLEQLVQVADSEKSLSIFSE